MSTPNGTKQAEILTLLNKYEGLIDEILRTQDKGQLEFKLKDGAKPECTRASKVT